MSDTISFDQFMDVHIRAGTIVEAQPFPEARKPALKLWMLPPQGLWQPFSK